MKKIMQWAVMITAIIILWAVTMVNCYATPIPRINTTNGEKWYFTDATDFLIKSGDVWRVHRYYTDGEYSLLFNSRGTISIYDDRVEKVIKLW